jgi:hypothetical protein
MGRSQIAGALLALAACSTGAGAAKLDKSACNVLNAELAGIVATGTRDDMERGPEWAKSNLSPRQLGSIRRLIELEEQLEFRCGMGRNRIVKIEAEPPKGPAGKTVIPEGPEKKPEIKTNAAKPAPDARKPAPRKAAAAAPIEPPATVGSTPPAAAAGSVPVATATEKPVPAVASDKPSRRQSSATYVSPAEVNPFFVTRYGDTQ